MEQWMKRDEYYDIGYDTERWWREHVRGIAPGLRHSQAKAYDFHQKPQGMEAFIDVKLCRTRYRKPGWVECKSWGKTTGILRTAIEHRRNPNIEVFIAVLHCGQWHLLDMKAMLERHAEGALPIRKQDVWADDGERCEGSSHWQLNGWSDPRLLIAEGPLLTKHWAPTTTIGKSINIDAWMEGEWKTK